MPVIAFAFVAFVSVGATQVDVVGAYAGDWQAYIRHFDTRYSKPAEETTTLRNECWRSAEFQVCHQFVDGRSTALIVYVCGNLIRPDAQL